MHSIQSVPTSRTPRVAASALGLSICLLLSLTAWGQTAYVTDGSGRDILAINNGTVSTVATLSNKLGNPLQVRIGGDNLLYVITPTNILRMTQTGVNPISGTAPQTVFSAGNTGATGFTGIRFDSKGNLYANTPAGVYVIPGVVQTSPASSFAKPGLLAGLSCSPSGDLAFAANGDLLIACNSGGSAVFKCPALSLPTSCSPAVVTGISGPVVGLAVDSLGDIVTSTGTSVNLTGPLCGGGSCTPIAFGTDIPAYLEAVPDPAGASAGCNSSAPSILVSTANSSGKSGKVWSIDTACAQVPFTKPSSPVATLSTNLPAIGLAAPATVHSKTKPTFTADTSTFNYGPVSLGILNQSTTGGPNCNLSMTKKQLPVSAIANALADNNLGLAASAINLKGEQSWVTGFHGVFPAGCLPSSSITHIGIAGFYSFINPHIVIIPDDPTGFCPSSVNGGPVVGHASCIDPLPFIYPVALLQGDPSDPFIKNQTFEGGFTTSPATIILADVGFSANNGAGYKFCGFLSPFNTGKKPNTINSGQSATFKFQVGTSGCSSNQLVDDTTAPNIVTGFSVGRIKDGNGNDVFSEANTSGKGNSVSPPSFKYDATGNLFLYTLDTTGYCNGLYEATVNSDSFLPQTLLFTVIGAPSTCQ